MIGWLCWPCWTGKPGLLKGREEQTVSSGSVSGLVLTKFVKINMFSLYYNVSLNRALAVPLHQQCNHVCRF